MPPKISFKDQENLDGVIAVDDISKRINFSVSMHSVPVFIDAMKDEGLDAYMRPTHGLAFDSYYYDIFIDIIKSPYFMPSVSAAIVAFIKRNDGKNVTVKRKDGSMTSLKGYSSEEVSVMLSDAENITVEDDKKPT